MDGNNIPHPKVICTDVDKLTDVAKSAGDTFLELLRLLPSPIPADSKVYESLEAIRGVPLECLAINNTDIGVQVDFINQDPETIIEETNTSDEYEIIQITSDKHLDAVNLNSVEIEIEPKQDNVKKSDKVMGIKDYEDSQIEPEVNETSKLQQSECDISNIETEQQTDIENDTETISMKSSNSNSTLTLENYSEAADTLVNTNLNHTLDSSVEVGIPGALVKQDTNETDVTVNRREIKIVIDTNKTIENTMKQDKPNSQKSQKMITGETPTNSTSELNNTASKRDSILSLVKPKNYKPEPREDSKIFGSEEDVKKCLQIAEKALAEHNYDKAKRMAEKADRIHPTPDARALLQKIRTVTEKAKEEAAAEKTVEKAKREAAGNASKDHQYLISEMNIEKGQEAPMEVGSCDQNTRIVSSAESIKLNADPDSKSTDSTKKRRAEGMISVAQHAFSQGDMSKAEKLAKIAQKLNPSEETDKFLEKIRHKSPQINTEKKENADPNVMTNIHVKENSDPNVVKEYSELTKYLLNKVKQCLASGRLDEAEQVLKHIHDPTVDVQSLKFQIRAARASRISNPDVKNCHSNEKPSDPKYRAKKNAESFVEIARNAIAAEDYEKAEKFLRKANAEYPSEISEKLLQEVQIELYSKDAKKSNDNNNCDAGTKKKDNSFVENMAKAESLYNQAKKELSNKNFDEAMDLVVKSQKLNRLAKVEGLKLEIIKARNRSENVESAKVNNCDSGASKVDEAFDLITQARTELKDKNLTKAEQLLGQFIEIHSTESAHGLLNEIRQRKSEPKHNQTTTINYSPTQNNDEAQKCMKLAEAAAKDKNFKKAEHFLEKSIRLSPSIEAREMLETVRVYLHSGKVQAEYAETQHMSNYGNGNLTHEVYNNEKDHGYLKTDVEKCIEVAMNAISAEDFEKAERFLKKAERIQPTEKAKELLEEVQKGLDDRKKEEQARLANEEKAEPLVSFAMTAIYEELYEFAEILLMNAWIKHKSGTAEKLIKQVRDIVAQVDTENSIEKKNKNTIQILDKQKGIAEECIKTARRMVSEGQLESPECVLIIAQNTYATNQAQELLTHIRAVIDFNSNKNQCHLKTKEWKFTKITKISKEGNKRRDAFKYNNYVQMAQRAYETGDFNVAKAFLLEAENLYPTKDIKKLIKQVDDAMK